MSKTPIHPDQTIPLGLTIVVCAVGALLLVATAFILNLVPFSKEHIIIQFRLADVLVGLTIYLKTSIDFAIFIGRLMQKYPGWKNRIAIEIGTALGNIAGTLVILVIWDLFREVRPLMAGMIILASLVLLQMAQDGFEHASRFNIAKKLQQIMQKINYYPGKILHYIIPHMDMNDSKALNFKGLFFLSLTVPFVLGADDFAGYLPLFNIINVVGFATGVFVGHMILNIALFISPNTTIKAVKNPVISFIGSLAFIALAVWGLREALHLLII